MGGRLTLRLALLALSALLVGAGMAALTHAQITPWPVTLTMTGPATAVSGQEITYRVRYRLTDPATISQTGFEIGIPRNSTYVSSQVVSGPAGRVLRLEETFVEWGALGNAEETEGDVELTVKIDADFVGSISTRAIEPGTLTAISNAVETQVFAPGALPQMGRGGPAAGSGRAIALVALGLTGAALIGAGAVMRHIRRER